MSPSKPMEKGASRSASSSRPISTPEPLSSLAQFAEQSILAAWALFITFAALLLSSLIPFAFYNPLWQGRLGATLINNGFVPLLGLVLVQLGLLLNPSTRIENLQRKLSRIAIVVCLGYLLLIPLQSWSSLRLIREKTQSFDDRPASPEQALDQMEKVIREAPDAKTMQANLTILRGPMIAPQDMARPLPQLKEILLKSLEAARKNIARTAAINASSQRTWQIVQETIRLNIVALGLALGFGSFAQRPGKSANILQEAVYFYRHNSQELKKKSSNTKKGANTGKQDILDFYRPNDER